MSYNIATAERLRRTELVNPMHAEELIEKLRSQILSKDEYDEAAELLEAIMADYRKVSRHLSQILDIVATSPPQRSQ